MPKLTRTLATIELADGTIHQDIRVTNPDLLRYREVAQKHGWPSLEVKNDVGKVPHLDYEQTFTAWAALRRLNLYGGTWEAFKDTDCVQVATETEEVDPTSPPAGGTPPPAAADSPSSSPTTPDSTSNGLPTPAREGQPTRT
jgi:hypothetical protein